MRLALLVAAALAACDPPPVPDAAPSPPPPVRAAPARPVTMPDALADSLVAADPLWADALRLHFDALVLDGHVDTPSRMLDDGLDLGARNAVHHLDVPRMAEGGLDAAFFALFVSRAYGEGQGATDRALAMLGEVERQVSALEGAAIARTAADVTRLHGEGRAAILLGLEGGHALQGSTEVLADLAGRGVRYVTLTHTNTNGWADSSQDEARHGGLTDRGREIVRAMQRLGVLVDLSHASDATASDAFDVAEGPVIFSHSSCRALTATVRNVSDAHLRRLADNGGVVMISLYNPFVNQRLTPDVMAAATARLADGGSLWDAVEAERRARGLSDATLDDVLDHVDHAVRVAGVDHVGIGTDFDGIPTTPDGLGDVTRLPWLTYGLLKRGYSEGDVRKILGANALRVLGEAEAVGARLRSREG